MIPRSVFIMVIAAICMFGGYGLAILNRPNEPVTLETKSAFRDRRFFVTFYADGGTHGNFGYTTKHGEFPSNTELKNFLYDDYKTMKNIVIWSITEWNETQYNQFWEK
jgi:hypothetical protein